MKETKNSAKMIKSMVYGAVVAMGVMLILCLLGGVLLSNEILGEGAVNYMGWVICGIAAWVGCWLAQRKAGGRRLPVSLGCGALLLLMMLIIGTMGEEQELLSWYGAAIVGSCAVVSALFASGKGTRRR